MLGVHVGRKATTVSLVDLAGRPAAHLRVATPSGSRSRTAAVTPVEVDALVATISKAAAGLVARHSHRTLLSAGVVAPWFDLGLAQEDVRRRLELATALPTAAADHVAAVAAAEYLAREEALTGCTMYLYARDTAGFALANDLPRRTEISRVGRLSHFPTGSDALCRCGATGCLEATISDEAVAAQARGLGVIALRRHRDAAAPRRTAATAAPTTCSPTGPASWAAPPRWSATWSTPTASCWWVRPSPATRRCSRTSWPRSTNARSSAPSTSPSPASAPGSRQRPPAPSRSVPVYEDPLALVRSDGAVANL